jgi:hypothetical protein
VVPLPKNPSTPLEAREERMGRSLNLGGGGDGGGREHRLNHRLESLVRLKTEPGGGGGDGSTAPRQRATWTIGHSVS